MSKLTGNQEFIGDVYMQGAGTYDGTNPTRGANDIATILHALRMMDSKAIEITSTPTNSITTIAGLEEIGLSAYEVNAAYNGLRTGVKDAAAAKFYPIWMASYTDNNNFSINYGTQVIVTTGALESISTYKEFDIVASNGAVTVTVKQEN